MRQPKLDAQSGFSLVELMVAMTVTLMISGAIFGLLSGGNTTFRREPVVADRQQNIRLAMDLITRDVQAGTGFVNANAVGINAPDGVTKTDGIFLFTPNPNCPDMDVNQDPPQVETSGGNINAKMPLPSCYSDDSLFIVFYADGHTEVGWGHNVHGQDGKDQLSQRPGPERHERRPDHEQHPDAAGTRRLREVADRQERERGHGQGQGHGQGPGPGPWAMSGGGGARLSSEWRLGSGICGVDVPTTGLELRGLLVDFHVGTVGVWREHEDAVRLVRPVR